MTYSRKDFLKNTALLTTGTFLLPGLFTSCTKNQGEELFFDISLEEWSFHKELKGGKLSHLQFPELAKNTYGINQVEYVNTFFKDKAKDKAYLKELNQRCDDLGVKQLLIMIDAEGELASTDEKKRKQAVENHHKWVEAAQFLGCHSIRVNLRGDGIPDDLKMASIDSLNQLTKFAGDYGISILVENHNGISSNAAWLASIVKQIDGENIGTLPDLGNFCLDWEGDEMWEGPCIEEYDRYKGIKELMPYAKGVSAKSYAFNAEGFETTIDYERMLNIIYDSGFRGHIGVEYEGGEMATKDAVLATKNLLLTLGHKITKKHGVH